MLKHYIHDNGRRCILVRGRWLHFDHEPPEPGPNDVRDYDCRMDHHLHLVRDGSVLSKVELMDLVSGENDDDVTAASIEWNIMPPPDVDDNINERIEPVRYIKHDGVMVDYGEHGYNVDAETDLARRILRIHLPEAMEHFLKRNAEYGDDNDFNLGVAGQYVDISRKVQKLKRRWWDDDERVISEHIESDKVIVMELIGHLLMSMDMLEVVYGSDREAGQDG